MEFKFSKWVERLYFPQVRPSQTTPYQIKSPPAGLEQPFQVDPPPFPPAFPSLGPPELDQKDELSLFENKILYFPLEPGAKAFRTKKTLEN